ncbi:multidrug effflux MFS transporter [Pararhodospirillum oryzae]|uniref:Bcr/CflA family efflux transporter n=1 Tax=Pararhodospirillum oryzae TaxID=478448 RepID=A0A512H3T0_9PROT|nr:multidrug effflux MFS transporter [Pararhodospirillum oryzae]GEO80097.1 Bcr/CflA family drug resistance efflux transporter [Pararhodospirillum oryzae]
MPVSQASPTGKHGPLLVLLLIGMVAMGALSTDMYLASLPDMTRIFNTDVSTVQMTLSVFAIGMAVGMLAYGPLSDRFGRKPVVIVSLVFYLGASLGCMLAPDIDTLIVARFIQALGACGGGVIGRAIVRDIWGRDGAAAMLSHMASAMALAPALAPIVGSFLHVSFGWKASFVVMAAFGGLLALLTAVVLSETNHHKDPSATDPTQILFNTRALLGDRCFMGHALVVAFAFGGLFSYLSGASFIIIDILGVDPGHFGFTFLAVAGAFLVGAQGGARFTRRLGTARMISIGVGIALVSSITGAVLAWAGIASLASVLPCVAGQFLACALIMPNGQAGGLGPYPRLAGTASSLMGFLQMGVGALAGYMVGAFHDATTRPLMTTLVVCSVAAALSWIGLAGRRRLPCADRER